MPRLLLVEDDLALARGITALLSDQGYAVDHLASGQAALEFEPLEPYALVVLDIGLPDMSGFDVLRALRRRGSRTPILVLTARDTIQDKVTGLDLGADDYLLKPFDPAELEARVRALIRRRHGDPNPTLNLGTMSLDRSSGLVRIGDRSIELRKRELAVLLVLTENVGRVVPKERLSAEVFAYDDLVNPNALELYVARLRKKLGPDGPHIRTHRGVGYQIDAL